MASEDDFDLAEYMKQLTKRSNAGDALLTAAIAEEWVDKLLLTHMSVSNSLAKRLFKGPLRSFSAKIDLARALRLVDDATSQDLRAIRAVRNAFAHTSEFLHFQSAEIIVEAASFTQWKDGRSVREVFDDAVTRAVRAMQAKMDAMVYAHATSGEDGS